MAIQASLSSDHSPCTQRIDPRGVWFLEGYTDVEQSASLSVQMRQFPFKIGRSSGLSLTLDCAKVSKLHAVINQEGSQIWLQDLRSKNGTLVNRQRITTDCVPLLAGDQVQFADLCFQVGCEQPSQGPSAQRGPKSIVDGSAMDLRKVLKTGDIVPHFQPLIRLATGDRLGYEVLARSHCRGLRGASVLFLAAQGLGLEAELSDLCRREGVRQGKSLPGRPTLFFNTHVTELKHPPFLASLREFREQNYVTPIVLEVQERKVDDFRAIRDLRDVSRGYGLQLAFDNVGGEQSRLEQLLELRPDFVKFDISMIHRIHRASPRQQQYLKSLVELTCESGATPVAEGVECPQEAEVCRRLGFVFAQGHHFGRPQCGADITAEQFKEKLARSTGTINLAQTQAVKTLRPLTGRPPETQLVGSANESPALTNP